MKLMINKYSPSALLMGLFIVFSVGCKEKDTEIDPSSRAHGLPDGDYDDELHGLRPLLDKGSRPLAGFFN